MRPNLNLKFRDSCYFCGAVDCRVCHCFQDGKIKFSIQTTNTWGDKEWTHITRPNFDKYGEDYVDPVLYWGDLFLEWEANKLIEDMLTS